MNGEKEATSARVCLIDLFCGAGGLSHGFLQRGVRPVAGVDLDQTVRHAYETNNQAPFHAYDIRDLDAETVIDWFDDTSVRILAGCAPCQPFSTYTQARKTTTADERVNLSAQFLRLVEGVAPEIVVSENVAAFEKTEAHRTLVDGLEKLGYSVSSTIVDAFEFGVPQHRNRFLLVASNLGHHPLLHFDAQNGPRTVREAIEDLPAIHAGQSDEQDPLHIAPSLSAMNLQRIRASLPGGTWRDWSRELLVGCHQRGNGPKYPSIYGRMAWDAPAPTITTQAYNYGSGRYGHPEQDRAISLREAALLQGFPREYEFVRPDEPVRFRRIGQMIGNAVPVPVARALAQTVLRHVEDHAYETNATLQCGPIEESLTRVQN